MVKRTNRLDTDAGLAPMSPLCVVSIVPYELASRSFHDGGFDWVIGCVVG